MIQYRRPFRCYNRSENAEVRSIYQHFFALFKHCVSNVILEAQIGNPNALKRGGFMKKIRGFLAAAFFLCLTMGIYSCGGKDKTPPVLTLYEHSTGYTEEEITILVATAADDKDGTVPVS